MRKWLCASLVLGFTLPSLFLAGCGGDDDDGGKATCALPSGAATASDACQSCVEASCSAEYSSYCSAKCGADMSSSACQQASAKAFACVLDECSDECVSGSGAGGAGSIDIPNGQAGEEPVGSGNAPNFACFVEAQGACTATTLIGGMRDMYEQACAQSGGVTSTACPAEDLVGCCSYGPTAKTCIYGSAAPAIDEGTCAETGGTWSEDP